jgi:hypothetical protein
VVALYPTNVYPSAPGMAGRISARTGMLSDMLRANAVSVTRTRNRLSFVTILIRSLLRVGEGLDEEVSTRETSRVASGVEQLNGDLVARVFKILRNLARPNKRVPRTVSRDRFYVKAR